MPRRRRSGIEEQNHKSRMARVDRIYGSWKIRWFTCMLMKSGKYTLAYRIVCDALDQVLAKRPAGSLNSTQKKEQVIELFDQIIEKGRPLAITVSKRLGGTSCQVPVDVDVLDGTWYCFAWLVKHARKRSGHSMVENLAAEMIDLLDGRGGVASERDTAHKMAFANLANTFKGKASSNVAALKEASGS